MTRKPESPISAANPALSTHLSHHNYGLYFTWWDRLMGTEHPAYHEKLRGKRDDDAASAAGKQYRPRIQPVVAMPGLSSRE